MSYFNDPAIEQSKSGSSSGADLPPSVPRTPDGDIDVSKLSDDTPSSVPTILPLVLHVYGRLDSEDPMKRIRAVLESYDIDPDEFTRFVAQSLQASGMMRGMGPVDLMRLIQDMPKLVPSINDLAYMFFELGRSSVLKGQEQA